MPMTIGLLLAVAPVLTMLLLLESTISFEAALAVKVALMICATGLVGWVFTDAMRGLGAWSRRVLSRPYV